MPVVLVRGLTLGEGRPKIIVPLFSAGEEEVLAQASQLGGTAADLAELRLDPLRGRYRSPLPPQELCTVVRRVRAALAPRLPLLVTMRTAAEGGERSMPPQEYAALLRTLLAEGGFDLLDVEYHTAGAQLAALCAEARAAGVAAVASMHNFSRTPPVEQMAGDLVAMGDAGADIAKLAVMPRTPADAAALLAATAAARAARPELPLITMAMGADGAVTRVCGGAFGSCATFGTAGAASAPGQPEAGALRAALDALAPCLA
ncbi:type I 3-dehydroquinate dehydratase [uncultured Gemmiger sp.]|uniref:type I 3-dehydroquinate dehydratase n=1 Tax=uncultured Gemmiger sp. TaxID=1623490 RepID=UPI0025DF726E|nr:type I 3-dehydroquinate dehydratase [uncultured Gemmiger sp.]